MSVKDDRQFRVDPFQGGDSRVDTAGMTFRTSIPDAGPGGKQNEDSGSGNQADKTEETDNDAREGVVCVSRVSTEFHGRFEVSWKSNLRLDAAET